MIFKMLENEQNQIVFLHLTKELDHQSLHQQFEFPIYEGLKTDSLAYDDTNNMLELTSVNPSHLTFALNNDSLS